MLFSSALRQWGLVYYQGLCLMLGYVDFSRRPFRCDRLRLLVGKDKKEGFSKLEWTCYHCPGHPSLRWVL